MKTKEKLIKKTEEYRDLKAKFDEGSLNEEGQKQLRAVMEEVEMLGSMYDIEERSKRQEEERTLVQDEHSRVEIAKRFASIAESAVSKGGDNTLSLRATILNEPAVHDASVPILFQDLAKPLEKGLIIDKLGCKIMYNVQGEPLFPEVDGFEASVIGENEKVSESTLKFTTIKSTPKRFSARVPVSRRAVNQSNLDLYGIVMEALGMSVARKLNHAMFDTTAHGEVKGLFVDLAPERKITRPGVAVTLDDVTKLEHSVLDTMTDAMSGRSAYVMNTKLAQALKNTPKVAGHDTMVLEMLRDGNTGHIYGMMNGYRVEFCNYVDQKNMLFGDFRYCGIPQFGNIDIIIDPYTLAGEAKVLFTLNVDMDIVKIRKEAFAMSTK